jgi:hypothetical protein
LAEALQVFLSSLELTEDVLEIGTSLKPSERAQQLEPVLVAWLHKTADSNARVRESAEASILGLVRADALSAELVASHAAAPLRKAGDVRGLLGRLSLLAYLVAEFGASAPLDRALHFAKTALSSPNGQVRQRAVDVCREVYQVVEPDSLGWLLEELKPAQRETLASVFAEVDAERSLHGDEADDDDGGGGAAGAGGASGALDAKGDDGLSDIAEGNEDESSIASSRAAAALALAASAGGATSADASGRLALPATGGGVGGGGGGGKACGGGNRLLSSTSELKGSFLVPPPSAGGAGGGGDSGAEGAAGAARQLQQQEAELASEEHICQFCGRDDPSFTDENLDLHFWRDCPMLMTCTMCDQVVEISYFREHLLAECENGEAPREGERIADGTCPLCGIVFPADDDGWTNHLLVRAARAPPQTFLRLRCGSRRPCTRTRAR